MKPQSPDHKLKPNKALNAKIKANFRFPTHLTAPLGYDNPGTISQKMAGFVPWNAADGYTLELLTKGDIRKEDVAPKYFKVLAAFIKSREAKSK